MLAFGSVLEGCTRFSCTAVVHFREEGAIQLWQRKRFHTDDLRKKRLR
jgi:hypothetical protein